MKKYIAIALALCCIASTPLHDPIKPILGVVHSFEKVCNVWQGTLKLHRPHAVADATSTLVFAVTDAQVAKAGDYFFGRNVAVLYEMRSLPHPCSPTHVVVTAMVESQSIDGEDGSRVAPEYLSMRIK